MDIKRFLRMNGIRQRDLAVYLGITDASVSNFVKGRNKISEENLEKILANEEWDTSMLSDGPVAIAIGHSSANAALGDISVESAQLAVLVKENEMLKKMLKDRDDTIELLKSLIEK